MAWRALAIASSLNIVSGDSDADFREEWITRSDPRLIHGAHLLLCLAIGRAFDEGLEPNHNHGSSHVLLLHQTLLDGALSHRGHAFDRAGERGSQSLRDKRSGDRLRLAGRGSSGFPPTATTVALTEQERGEVAGREA